MESSCQNGLALALYAAKLHGDRWHAAGSSSASAILGGKLILAGRNKRRTDEKVRWKVKSTLVAAMIAGKGAGNMVGLTAAWTADGRQTLDMRGGR